MFAAHNMMLTGTASALAYDSIGAGWTMSVTGTSISASESHTAAAGATVLVFTNTAASGSVGSYSSHTRTVTYGSTTLTSVGAVNANNQTFGWTEAYIGIGVGTGTAQTISWTTTGGSGTFLSAAMNSVAYRSVGSIGTVVTNFGGSTTPSSGAVAAATSNTVVTAFGSGGPSSFSITSFSGTSRYNTAGNSGSYFAPLAFGDTPGASSVTTTGTMSANFYWGSIAVPLIP